jgi:hypothetical protein
MIKLAALSLEFVQCSLTWYEASEIVQLDALECGNPLCVPVSHLLLP